jgi:hypothetical protein
LVKNLSADRQAPTSAFGVIFYRRTCQKIMKGRC